MASQICPVPLLCAEPSSETKIASLLLVADGEMRKGNKAAAIQAISKLLECINDPETPTDDELRIKLARDWSNYPH